MTTEQAHARLVAEAERHRKEDRWHVAHEWQMRANEFARLTGLAQRLPSARRKRRDG